MGAVSTNPDIIIVAPVSPRLLVNARMDPAITPSFIIGRVTVLNTVIPDAPKVLAASSYNVSAFSKTIFIFRTI